MNKKVSVIMASYLGEYPNAAKNRDKKFVRAVNTFLKQTYENKELIIVADGCPLTYQLFKQNFDNLPNVKCILSAKKELFDGEIRNIGLRNATGDIISYLDSDDVLGKNHLDIIMKQFTDDVDFVYYNDYLVLSPDFKKFQMRFVEPKWASIGTSSITHKKLDNSLNINWEKGYGHDFLFLSKMISAGMKFKKLSETPNYYVTHWGDMNSPNHGDF